MISTHHPAILILLEPRVHSSSIMAFLNHIGYTDMLAVEACGFAGGIWLLWDCDRVDIVEVDMTDQLLSVMVRPPSGEPWLLSTIYASPQAMNRLTLWVYLSQLGTVVNLPWLLISDTNQSLESRDKVGGKPVNRQLAAKFHMALDACNFIDLGFNGPRYTWSNGRQGPALIWERLDRAWGNVLWNNRFDKAVVQHLVRVHSDHHPLLLYTPHLPKQSVFRGFRFLEAWFHHPEFGEMVHKFWKTEPGPLEVTMEEFKTNIWQWNNESFGNIFWRKKRCKARLLGVQMAMARNPRKSL